jgi:hypothetical protein
LLIVPILLLKTRPFFFVFYNKIVKNAFYFLIIFLSQYVNELCNALGFTL